MKENLELQENLIKAMIGKAVKERKSDLEALGRNIKTLKPTLTEKFHVMKYKEAIDRVGIKFGQDFGAEEERVFSEKFDKPIFITHYPKSLKPFYMKEDPLDKQVVLNNDLLAPEGYGEIIGASVREDDYDKLFNAIKAKGYNPKDYEWYLDLRKYGSVPHAGFGLGLERVTAWLCKLEHIRDAIPFPRTVDRTKP
jgi:asparaginyl-tRNA synthetase